MSRTEEILRSVGPRLRELRAERGLTLAATGERTGISVSTLSRLESGHRQANLELLLQLAEAYDVTLDDLLGPTATDDPRIPRRPMKRYGQTIVPLSRHAGGVQAFQHTIVPSARARRTPETRTHDGYEWLYVLHGRLRLVLGEHDLVLTAGEVAEFDCRVPHWFGGADADRVEFLSLFGAQGERMHVRAKTRA